MKKNFVKKTLASTLALAMVVTAVPASTASAAKAKAPKLNKTSKTLYINDNEIGSSYDFNISNKVAKSTYKWTTSNKAVATVNSKGLTKAATKTGKATISCKITLPTKKTKTLKATVTVKENATEVKITNAPEKEIGIGETAYDFNSSMTSASGAKATDYRQWQIEEGTSNTAGATIDAKTGVVTTKTAGEFKVRVVAYQNKAKLAANDVQVSDWLTVKVKASITAVTQTVTNQVKVSFDDNMKDKVKAADFVIKNKATTATQQIKGISFSDDGKDVTIETYIDFADAATYNLTFAGVDTEFTTSIGEVARLEISPATVTVNEETSVVVKAYNANGVDITSVKGGDITVDDSENTSGWYDSSTKKIVIFKTGATAKIKATYHTYKYNTDGTEAGIVVAETVITAVDKTIASYESNKYTIAGNTTSVNFDKLTENNGTICVGDSNKALFVKIFGTDKKEVTNYAELTAVSGNENVVIVNGSLATKQVDITPVAEGSTVVIVKDKDGKALFTIPVVVKAKRVASTVSVDTTSVTSSNVADKIAEKKIKVTVKDQYGEKSATSDVDFTAELTPLNNKDKTFPQITNNGDGTITIDSKGADKGSYTYKVTIDGGKKVATYTVTVIEKVTAANATTGYRFDLSSQTADTIVSSKDDVDKKVPLKVVETKNGVENADVTTATAVTVEVTKDGKPVTGVLDADNQFIVTKKNGKDVTKTATGTYYITAITGKGTAAEKVVAKTAIIVTDTQSKMTFKANKLVTDTATSGDLEAVLKETCEFYYNGATYKGAQIVKAEVDNDNKVVYTDQQRVFIRNANVTIEIDGFNVTFSVAVNTTFTVK